MKKKLLKTTFTEKLEKVTKFFNISKTYKSQKIFPQLIGCPDARKTIGKT